MRLSGQDTTKSTALSDEQFVATSLLDPPIFDMVRPPAGLVLWSTEIGNSTGPITVDSGNVFVGTNNSRKIKFKKDCGVMACVRCRDGQLLWQVTHDRLPLRVNDIPTQAIKSKLSADGERGYYVSNRGELVCVDLQAPNAKGEHLHPKSAGDDDGRKVWTLDMVKQLGVFKRDAGDVGNPICSPLVLDGLVYCLTGHGSSARYVDLLGNKPFANAPSFIAVDKFTGTLAWSSDAPGNAIPYGQWASPVGIQVQDITQVVFPGGDGVLYGFHPVSGVLEWSLDCNSPERTAWDSNHWGTRCFFDARPSVVDGILYAALGQDIETPADFVGPIVAVDLKPIARREPPVFLWTYEDKKLGHASGEVQIADGRLYAISKMGTLLVLNAITGEEISQTCFGESCAMLGSPCLFEKRILVTTDSELLVYSLDDPRKCLSRYQFSEAVENSPVVRDGTVYLTTRGHLWALDQTKVLVTQVDRGN